MSTRSGRVFGFGSACVDFRIRTAELGEEYREKLLAQETWPMGGGSTSNCLAQVSRLGGEAHWLGKLGTDPVGDIIIHQLEDEGVGTGCCIRDPAALSPFNLAAYAGEGMRRIGGFLLPNCLAEITPEEIHRLAEHVHGGDWVIVEIGEIPLEDVDLFCTHVKERGGMVAVDVDLDPITQCGAQAELIRRVFSHADVLIPNRTAVRSLYGEDDAEHIAAAMGGDYGVTVVVTAGEDGAWFAPPGESPRHQAPFPAEVVDTVGAGDAFHGGLLFGLADGWPLERAVRLAAACGAAACGARGARTGMPTQEIFDILS